MIDGITDNTEFSREKKQNFSKRKYRESGTKVVTPHYLNKGLKSKPSNMALFQKLKIFCEITGYQACFLNQFIFLLYLQPFSFYEHLKTALNFRQ